MSSFFAFAPLIFWALIIIGIVFEVKAVKNKQYRPFYKIGWFYIAIGCIIMLLITLSFLPR